MKFMDFHPPEQPAALLGPQKPIGFLRGTKVLGRAGARGGAGAERDGNDCNSVKLTELIGIFMKPKNLWSFCIFTNFHGTELKYLNPGRLGRLAARDTEARAGPWPGP